jgi:hypothetical protein
MYIFIYILYTIINAYKHFICFKLLLLNVRFQIACQIEIYDYKVQFNYSTQVSIKSLTHSLACT